VGAAAVRFLAAAASIASMILPLMLASLSASRPSTDTSKSQSVAAITLRIVLSCSPPFTILTTSALVKEAFFAAGPGWAVVCE